MANPHPDWKFEYTVDGICERISVYLNDATPGNSNCRWSKDFLRSQIIDALYLAARLAPEHFTSEETWTLETGKCFQSVPEHCGRLIEVLCITDLETGEVVDSVEVDTEMIKRMQLYPTRCSSSCKSGSSGVQQFSLDVTGTSETGFTVFPAPDVSGRYEVTARCVNINEWTDGEAGLCEEIPASLRHLVGGMVHLVTSQVLLMNRDDPTIAALANQHLAQFSTLLGIVQNVNALFAANEVAA